MYSCYACGSDKTTMRSKNNPRWIRNKPFIQFLCYYCYQTIITKDHHKNKRSCQSKKYREKYPDEIKRRKHDYYMKNRDKILPKMRQDYADNIEEERSHMRWRYATNHNGLRDKRLAVIKTDKVKKQRTNFMIRNRMKAVKVLGGENPYCKRCGCDRIEMLEIHHKLYNALDDRASASAFYNKIIRGIRAIDDLELLCKTCNFADYVEKKFGVEDPYIIIWSKEVDKPLMMEPHTQRS